MNKDRRGDEIPLPFDSDSRFKDSSLDDVDDAAVDGTRGETYRRRNRYSEGEQKEGEREREREYSESNAFHPRAISDRKREDGYT